MTDYYEKNAPAYHAATVNVDPASFLLPLIARLDAGATMLDIGCGSGRDLLWLKTRGFRPTGFEQAPSLAELARHHSGCEVIDGDFAVFDFSPLQYDALLLIGSLVHVPREDLKPLLARILAALRPGGHILLTLKEGSGEDRNPDGRVFTLWSADDLETLFAALALKPLDLSRQISKIRPTDVWLGYLLRAPGGDTGL